MGRQTINALLAIVLGSVVLTRPSEYSVVVLYAFGLSVTIWGTLELLCDLASKLRNRFGNRLRRKR